MSDYRFQLTQIKFTAQAGGFLKNADYFKKHGFRIGFAEDRFADFLLNFLNPVARDFFGKVIVDHPKTVDNSTGNTCSNLGRDNIHPFGCKDTDHSMEAGLRVHGRSNNMVVHSSRLRFKLSLHNNLIGGEIPQDFDVSSDPFGGGYQQIMRENELNNSVNQVSVSSS